MDIEKIVAQELESSSYERDRTRPNLGKLYRFLIQIFTITAHDMRSVFRGFFPGLASQEFLEIHIRSLALPEIANESELSMKQRLKRASDCMRYLGTRKALKDFMNTNFASRWEFVEFPADAFTIGAAIGTRIGRGKIMRGEGLYISVENITSEERRVISAYIDGNTPPDVGLTIFNKKNNGG